MATENARHLEEILFDALDCIEESQDRVTFLDQTCRDNPSLRARLEELTALRDEAEKFFATAPEVAVIADFPETPAASPAADFKEGLGTRIGRYRLGERLGEGGCGTVYLAEQLEPVRRRVALKIIRVGMDTANIIERFEMERQTLALMDHPNIARVFDAGATSSGRPFFVMQLVEGLRITDFCDQNRLDPAARLRLFIPVCKAIQHAHQKGIIHCDIKPSNVLITLHDGVAVPKVIDFGIAKATENGTTDSTASPSVPLIGTPAYMSPEQMDGGGMDVDTRSDIYSLGVVLYEMLAGQAPHGRLQLDQSNPDEIRNLLRESPVLKPSECYHSFPADKLAELAEQRRLDPARLARTLHGDLDAIIMKAMEPDRQRRYGTASELAADLSHYLNAEPVNARRAGRAYRLGKLVRRNKATFAAGTMVVLALGGGFGTSTWLFFREASARQEQARLRNAAEVARASEVELRKKAQAGETVAHAAVLISHDKIAEADTLLASLEPDDVPASLESATTFRLVGEWLLREGRWEDASRRFGTVAQVIVGADRSLTESISIHFVAAAAAVTEAGDTEHYDRLRKIASEQFATTTNPVVADEVVKSCLIQPAGPEFLVKLEPLLKVIERNIPWERNDGPKELMEAWQMLSMSLAAFRKNDFQVTETWARRCLRHPHQNPSRNAAVHAVLAMALHRAGHPADARAERDLAQSAVTANFSKPFQMGGSADGFWFDWVIARILLNEADGVIAH